MYKLSANVGNDPLRITEFENWLGRNVDYVPLHGDRRTWTQWRNVLSWIAGQFAGLGKEYEWVLPMITEEAGVTLANAANGSYDSHYTYAANTILANHSSSTGDIWIRLGVEFNGGWFPWKSLGKEAEYKSAWVRIVNIFRGTSPRFKFIWNPNIGQNNPEYSYPGDAYVDAMSMDFYHQPTWDPLDPTTAWEFMKTRSFGLQWFRNFAAAHSKPEMYSEWGVKLDNFGSYIDGVAAWFNHPAVVRQAYWDNNSVYTGKLSDGTNPNTGAAFIYNFSQPVSSGPTVKELQALIDSLEATIVGLNNEIISVSQENILLQADIIALQNSLTNEQNRITNFSAALKDIAGIQ